MYLFFIFSKQQWEEALACSDEEIQTSLFTRAADVASRHKPTAPTAFKPRKSQSKCSLSLSLSLSSFDANYSDRQTGRT